MGNLPAKYVANNCEVGFQRPRARYGTIVHYQSLPRGDGHGLSNCTYVRP